MRIRISRAPVNAGDRPGGEERAGCVRGLGAQKGSARPQNTPVRVDSKGDGGRVSQSNSVESDATALNVNLTKQDADQDQGGRKDRCCDRERHPGDRPGRSEQDATRMSAALQDAGHDKCGCPSSGNTNSPVRVDSKGDDGSVHQSNSVDSDATAANLNALKQDADQDQVGLGGSRRSARRRRTSRMRSRPWRRRGGSTRAARCVSTARVTEGMSISPTPSTRRRPPPT